MRSHSSVVRRRLSTSDPLIVAVEPQAELAGVEHGAEQPGAVADRTELTEHSSVGEPNRELWVEGCVGERQR